MIRAGPSAATGPSRRAAGGGGGGSEAEKKFVYRKSASNFGPLLVPFIFPWRSRGPSGLVRALNAPRSTRRDAVARPRRRGARRKPDLFAHSPFVRGLCGGACPAPGHARLWSVCHAAAGTGAWAGALRCRRTAAVLLVLRRNAGPEPRVSRVPPPPPPPPTHTQASAWAVQSASVGEAKVFQSSGRRIRHNSSKEPEGKVASPGRSLRDQIFFLLRTAPRDHQPPTANYHEPPIATNRQPRPTATNHPSPSANRRQPPPTAANHQLPTGNLHQPPTANRHQPWLNMSYTWSFLKKPCSGTVFLFFFR